MIRARAWVLAALVAAGCHDPDAYTVGPSQADAVLSVTVSAPAIPADTVSRVTVTIQLDPDTDVDKRTVTVTTTAGTLSGGGREGSSVAVQADTSGRASAELRSGSTPGVARVDVTAGGVTRSESVAFLAVSPSDLYDVALSPASIPADGFSTSRVTVTLKRIGEPPQRSVRFETSAGLLTAVGQPAGRNVTVTADTSGRATAELQSDRTVGIAQLRVTALEAIRDVSVPFTPVGPGDIIGIPTPRSIASYPADGATAATVTAAVAPGLPPGRRSVTFRTTIGTFLPGRTAEITVDAGASNVVRAELVSLAPGTARVTATVDGFTVETQVEFVVALPDALSMLLGAGSLRSGGSMMVTVRLVRNTGTVTARLPIAFSAVTDRGVPIGGFVGVPIAEGGVVSLIYDLGTTSYVGFITIRASVEGGASATGSVRIVP
jgi:hypothetical protein